MFSPIFLRGHGEAARSPRVEKQMMAPLAYPVNACPWEKRYRMEYLLHQNKQIRKGK